MKFESHKLYIGKFNSTKPKELRLDYLYQHWDFKFVICEWRADDTWKICRKKKVNSRFHYVNWSITKEQANKIINDLGLVPLNVGFRSAFDWRTKKDWLDLERYTFGRNYNL